LRVHFVMMVMTDQTSRLMSDACAEKLKKDGWTLFEDDGFLSLVGPLWYRKNGKLHEYAIDAQPKHKNRRGYVQGGLLMTLADRSLGMAAREGSGASAVVTIQMDTHFIDAAKIGELLISTPHMVRATRTLVFLNTELTADGRCVAMASGVFKIVKGEG
jgi:acyl-coenzyme A thioesterase PaaI-like protein